ncbi:MAG: 4-hydroxy-tetrahydrodipicolinate synthase [Bdellovibrionales bacterium GWA2_49_15]|nr:MAG: 4-hydroxy-tetrahydrodipicolinate synthase [Bdellovibrionales bacterium GWA2_49_15]
MNVRNYPLWTALVTPLTNDGSIDYPTLKKLIKAQEEAKNGLLILGSTGESLNLDDRERRDIVEFVLGLAPQVPIMVGVGGINLKETLSWLSFLEKFPIHAYLLVVPLYAKPGVMGQYYWFKALLDHVSKPCMIYNIPGRSATPLQVETVRKLRGHRNFWAIKEASGKEADFKNYKEAAGPSVQLYSGDDSLLPSFVPLGCEGLVSVASNAWPKETHSYVKMALDGATEVIKNWVAWSNVLFEASNPVPVKRLMFEQGQIRTPNLRPPLTHEDLVDATNLIKADREVRDWFSRSSHE